jgi:hypothetical protein
MRLRSTAVRSQIEISDCMACDRGVLAYWTSYLPTRVTVLPQVTCSEPNRRNGMCRTGGVSLTAVAIGINAALRVKGSMPHLQRSRMMLWIMDGPEGQLRALCGTCSIKLVRVWRQRKHGNRSITALTFRRRACKSCWLSGSCPILPLCHAT